MLRPIQYRNFCRGRAHCRLSRVSSRWIVGAAIRAPGHARSARCRAGGIGPDWTELNWIDGPIVYGPSAPPRTPPAGAAGKSPCGEAAQEERNKVSGPKVQRVIYGDVPSWYIILTLIGDSSRRTAIFLCSSSIATCPTCLPPLLLSTPTADHFPMAGSFAMMSGAYCCARSITRADSVLWFDSYGAWYVGESRNAVSIA